MTGKQVDAEPGHVIRLLTRLYPRAFREEFGAEIMHFMQERSRERRYRVGWRGRTMLAAHLLADTARAAAGAHVRAATARFRAVPRSRVDGARPENRMNNVLQDLDLYE